MGIGDPETAKNRGFEPFHGRGFGFVRMIITENVEEAMEYQMGQMRLDRQPLRIRLAKNRLAGKDHIAEDGPQPTAGAGRRGKRQDVGRIVFFSKIAV